MEDLNETFFSGREGKSNHHTQCLSICYSFKKKILKQYIFSRKGYLLWPQFPTEHNFALVEAVKLCFDHGKMLFFWGKHLHRPGNSLKGPGPGRCPIFSSPQNKGELSNTCGESLNPSAILPFLDFLASGLSEEKSHFVLFWGIFKTQLWHVWAAPHFQTGSAHLLPCHNFTKISAHPGILFNPCVCERVVNWGLNHYP